jgi:hypothetical protein
MAMPIAIMCECGKSIRVKDEFAGKKVRCPACKAVVRVPAVDDEVPTLEEPASPKPSSRLEEVRREWRKKQPDYERDPEQGYEVDGVDPTPERSRSRRSERDENDNYDMKEEDRRPEPPRKKRKKRAASTPMTFHLPWNHVFGVGALLVGFVVLALILISVQSDRSLSPRGVFGLISLFVTAAGAIFAFMNGEDE